MDRKRLRGHACVSDIDKKRYKHTNKCVLKTRSISLLNNSTLSALFRGRVSMSYKDQALYHLLRIVTYKWLEIQMEIDSN